MFGDELNGFGFAQVDAADEQARLDAATDLAPDGTIPVLNDQGEVSFVPETRGQACAGGDGACDNFQDCVDQGGESFGADAAAECEVAGLDLDAVRDQEGDINDQIAAQLA